MAINLPFQSKTSRARVFYAQPSSVKVDLLPLYEAAAREIDCHPSLVRAFAIVESDEKPFTAGGFPVIRFEAHKWRQYRVATKEAVAFDKAANSKDLDVRWQQFLAMADVNEEAAIKSHSFGLFQIMGFNHAACGFASATLFLQQMKDPAEQVKAFKRFVLGNPPLLAAIRKHNAQQVGLHYNGPQYKRNKYDVKWAAASKAGGVSVWA